MSRMTLTQRVAALEQQLGSLLKQIKGERDKDWRRTIGAFAGDDFMREVFAEGKRIRQAEKKKARPKAGRKHNSPRDRA